MKDKYPEISESDYNLRLIFETGGFSRITATRKYWTVDTGTSYGVDLYQVIKDTLRANREVDRVMPVLVYPMGAVDTSIRMPVMAVLDSGELLQFERGYIGAPLTDKPLEYALARYNYMTGNNLPEFQEVEGQDLNLEKIPQEVRRLIKADGYYGLDNIKSVPFIWKHENGKKPTAIEDLTDIQTAMQAINQDRERTGNNMPIIISDLDDNDRYMRYIIFPSGEVKEVCKGYNAVPLNLSLERAVDCILNQGVVNKITRMV